MFSGYSLQNKGQPDRTTGECRVTLIEDWRMVARLLMVMVLWVIVGLRMSSVTG